MSTRPDKPPAAIRQVLRLAAAYEAVIGDWLVIKPPSA